MVIDQALTVIDQWSQGLKDAILVWFTTAIERLFKVVQAQTKLQIEKSAGITVARNLVTDMGSASRFELALFMRKLLTR